MVFNIVFHVLGISEKDVLCDECGQAFASTDLMKRHRYRVHSESYRNRIECPYCNYKNYAKAFVKRHMKTKHKDLPFSDSLIVVKDFVPAGRPVGP